MPVKLTTLSDNIAAMGNYLAEWGLSILVESNGSKILLDTGLSVSVVHNAEVLNINLAEVDKIVLSHGHSDHTGGLREVLRYMKKEVEVFAHPNIFQMKYDRRENRPPKYIGMPFQRDELESLGARFQLSKEPMHLTADITITGEIPMVTNYEQVDQALFYKQGQKWQADPVLDDQALIINTEQGLIILLGCAHRGMINTLYQARKITGISKIAAIIGGAHLIGASEERLWLTIAALKEMEVAKLALSHCTDLSAMSVLAQEFGEVFIFSKTGLTINFP